MGKNKLRSIVVQENKFLWNRTHLHKGKSGHDGCIERVTVYLDGFKNTPLVLLFKETDNMLIEGHSDKRTWVIGYPEDGVIWLSVYKPPLPNNAPYPPEERITKEANLNRPGIIAKLILHFYDKEWHPEEEKRPLTIEHALPLVDELELFKI